MSDSSADLSEFAHKLVTWYQENKRSLPWRETKDPYRILVSETMLQQTRVDTVIPYYHRFLDRFPTLEALAAAPEDDVLKLWQGLGYYSRARNLQRAAQRIVEDHQGVVPEDAKAVGQLPGVGPYTTGAVMSIAYNRPVAAVDGNVLRVIARYKCIIDPVDDPKVKSTITDIVQSAIEASTPSLFTQAVMELGAMVCTPRRPTCEDCPVQSDCLAYEEGKAEELPHKRPKRAKKKRVVVSLWLEQEGALLVEKRPDSGLLSGMWQLPSVELEPTDEWLVMSQAAEERLSQILSGNNRGEGGFERNKVDAREHPTLVAERIEPFAQIANAKHVFTHLEWDVRVLRPVGFIKYLDPSAMMMANPNLRWVALDQLPQLVWPRVYEIILGELLDLDMHQMKEG